MLTRTTLVTLLLATILMTANIGAASDASKIVVMPVETGDNSLNEGVAVIAEILADYFKDNRAVTIISAEQKEALAGADTGNRLQLIQTITAKMAGGQALIFSLLRYRERVGDQYSVQDPASLAFDFKLLNAADGRVTCSGQFDETQEALTENILDLPQAFKRGFRWLTVRELATEAIRDRLATCPALAGAAGQ
jgi:hypothetical protein